MSLISFFEDNSIVHESVWSSNQSINYKSKHNRMNLDVLECQICLENYDANHADHLPKLLPCGHTFCASCIDKLLVNIRETKHATTIMKCPNCLKTKPTPSCAAHLINNYTIISLLESLASNGIEALVSCLLLSFILF